MRFSIIIPVYNAEKTLKACLDAIFDNHTPGVKNSTPLGCDYGDYEVILVDDKSSDRSTLIAKEYPCTIITLSEHKGPGFARNIGKDNAKGETLIFIDSDIVIPKNALTIIDRNFKENKDIAAVTGILSKSCPNSDFFSQYKNLYMHYIFKICPKNIDFLYGSLMAIKKNALPNFNENNLRSDDTELGQKYKALKKKILLNPDLQLTHLKKYNFKEIIKNDFLVPFSWAKSFILYKGAKDLFIKKRFAHAGINQIVSILMSFLIIISFFQWHSMKAKYAFFTFLILFLLLNYNFFTFLYKEKGISFLIKSIFFTFLDNLVMGLGIAAGFVRFAYTPR